MADGLPALTWDGSGRKLVVLESDDAGISVAGTYGSGAETALISVDMMARRTRVWVPAGDPQSRRWPDWLGRTFLGSRLLADGWMLLHGSAVRVETDDGARAVLVLAGQRGGKSTLAYRACTELGAALMGDDLVLVRAGADAVWVIGWPTRICFPAEILPRHVLGSLTEQLFPQGGIPGAQRRRVILSPGECGRVPGITRAGPARLGAIICISTDASAPSRGSATLMSGARVNAAVAKSAEIPAQRMMMLDLLGLVGAAGRASSRRAGPITPWHRVLAGVPAIAVGVNDPARLPALPVWELASRFLSWLGVPR
jgi:hypothetical protein